MLYSIYTGNTIVLNMFMNLDQIKSTFNDINSMIVMISIKLNKFQKQLLAYFVYI